MNYRYLILLVCFFSPASANAQVEVSAGIDVLYPVLMNSYNSKLHYGQLGFGMCLGVAYKPEETQFFPILKTSFGRTRLPLKEIGKNVMAMNFNYLNVMLNENIVLRFPQSELFVYGGIGFSNLSAKGMKLAGPTGEMIKHGIDSTRDVSKFFPAVNIGFEYNYGESAGKDLYLTLGLNFQYIMLLSNRNNYYFYTNEPGVGVTRHFASLSGGAIVPNFYVALHYMLRLKK
ncbi:MAG: hypothetical protein K0Q79_3224 [Flavipsychrobacter sp.]|jgi:hypothetical protein|nr:hypothetical protein [Flavipsychrobacter sp.]